MKRMTLNQALEILMRAAERDVRGAGCGVRETSDEWREEVSQAWSIAFRRVHWREPDANEYRNAGMKVPAGLE